MFTAAAALFVLWSAMFTCRPTTTTAVESITVTLEWRASVITVSPSLLNAVDRRLLFNADGSRIFMPRSRRSPSAVLVALLLLRGGVESNPGPATLNFGLMNARSAVNKAAHIHDVLADHRLDVAAITETWITSDAPDAVKLDIAPAGYHVIHAHRGSSADRGGGGVAVIHRDSVKVTVVDMGKYATFELLCVRINASPCPVIAACIYRPPGPVSTDFCDDLSKLFDQLMLSGLRHIVCGDLNCPGQRALSLDDRLNDVLQRHNQRQLVNQPTHVAGNVLDVLIVPDCWADFASDVDVRSLCFTDHSLVLCQLGVKRERPMPVTYHYRCIKQIDLDEFRRRVLQSQLYRETCASTHNQSVDDYVKLFDDDITRILDDCAPLRSTIRRSGSHDCRLLSTEARAAKRACRRAERRYRRTGSDAHRAEFNQARQIARQRIDESRVNHIKSEIAAAEGDSRRLWRTAKQLLHSSPPSCLSDSECAALSASFCAFFNDKVDRILTTVRAVARSMTGGQPFASRDFTGQPLVNFDNATSAEVLKLINKLSHKSSPRDVLPASLLKSCCDLFAPILAHLANLSFKQGVFPTAFKIAQVLPLLKKSGLGRSVPANYRPISNLNTISKIVERLVLARLMPHFLASGNFNPLQSAYRTGHSTETALLRILDSLYKSIDTVHLTTLIGLDLSAAFDTISHSILLGRIRDEFGVSGAPLRWLQSYLTDRRHYVKLGRHCSSTVQCTAGVPQGSVLGPILFAAYISPVGQLITSHGVEHHQYADDTQLFLAMRASMIRAGLSTLEACTRDVKRWFAENDLLLNADKSEVMMIGTPAQLRAASSVNTVAVADANLTLSSKLKSLGVILDSRLSFDAHVAMVCKTCNYHIWALRHIRRLLPLDVARMLACSIVGARLDYCNSVLHGAPTSSIQKLQRVQNSLARVVLQQPRMSHARPLLKSLHWLPVCQRIEFKVAALVYKIRSTSHPAYLHSLLSNRISGSSATLRSASRPLLHVPRTRTVYGSRAFSVAAPTLWNSLPADITNSASLTVFRNRLKTFLFHNIFSGCPAD